MRKSEPKHRAERKINQIPHARKLLRKGLILFYEILQRSETLNRITVKLVTRYLRSQFHTDAQPIRSMLENSRIGGFDVLMAYSFRPVISVLLPVYNTQKKTLAACIDSVLCQTYKNFELCIVDDGSDRPHIRSMLEAYAAGEPRIRLCFSDRNHGISATIHKCLNISSGLYAGVLDHDDMLEPGALFEYMAMLNIHPQADLIYCDEDKIDEQGNCCDPWYKSDWNPDLSLSFNYVMHFAVYKRTVFDHINAFNNRYEGSQDYDLLLRASENTQHIYHIPKILYHWRISQGSIAKGPESKPHIFIGGLAALNDALIRRHINGTAVDAPNAWKGVYRVIRTIQTPVSCSIIIDFSGDVLSLDRLLNSIARFLATDEIQVLVCARKTTTDENNQHLENFNAPWLEWIFPNKKNSISAAFNHAVEVASGKLLWFLDDRMELMDIDSFRGLVEHVQRKEVGAAGGKIFHENGFIEHAGVILGPFGLVGYAHRATPDNPGYVGLKSMISNYSAVMGFGMATRKSLFEKVNGFDENLPLAYWDVDYCLKLRQKNYLITFTPYARMMHHVPVKSVEEMIVEPEATLFKNRWNTIIENDPYFNPNFSRKLEDFTVNDKNKVI